MHAAMIAGDAQLTAADQFQAKPLPGHPGLGQTENGIVIGQGQSLEAQADSFRHQFGWCEAAVGSRGVSMQVDFRHAENSKADFSSGMGQVRAGAFMNPAGFQAILPDYALSRVMARSRQNKEAYGKTAHALGACRRKKAGMFT